MRADLSHPVHISQKRDWLDDLNPEQIRAVCATDGPSLVLAGAGSGKTRALTYRIAYLIDQKGVAPWNILAVTFTNKAAGEIAERVIRVVGERGRDVTVGTFHSVCLRILRRELSRLGRRSDFVVYDVPDQISLMNACLKKLNIDSRQLTPKAVLWRIDQAKNAGIDAEKFAHREGYDLQERKIADLYVLYQQDLAVNNAMDFGDLILETIRLFEREPDVLARCRRRYRYVLVDEYQDTNRAQYIFFQLLTGQHGNIFVVGDDDQSIYRWRGADLRNILDFESDHPGALVIRLEHNYRSSGNILASAHAVVSQNIDRKEKKLWTHREPGELLVHYVAADEQDEARYVVKEIERLRAENGLKYGDVAVFYRTNAQSRAFEEVFSEMRIPHVVVGAIRFYQRKEIKDLIAYLRVLANPEDGVSLRRIINEPPRGIGRITLQRAEEVAAARGLTLMEALRESAQEGLLGAGTARKIRDFIDLVDSLQGMVRTLGLAQLIRETLGRSGYAARLQEEDGPEAKVRLDNLNEFCAAAEEFQERQGGGLRQFLDRIALLSSVDEYQEEKGRVSLMTLHNAKGLEFAVVIITGMEQGFLPHYQSIENEDELEEERRLCYVGMTRARDRLYLTRARYRRVMGPTRYRPPSQFLDDIPSNLMRIMDSEQAGESDYTASHSRATKTHDSSVPLGKRVFHATFGVGWVIGSEGHGADLKLTVFFARGGKRKLMARYASLQSLD
ncbi:MAG: UvrD-helicase domain-containing protein [Deltaproteobacteria bacterium]|nr:UvrD-helicase domain-containing protein [Deltaproteobacteria bacterium]